MTEQDFIPYHAIHELPKGNVLVLAPHPDDEVFGCGGAIQCHVEQGDHVTVLLATDGRAAEPHIDDTACQAYIAKRRAESQAAADILGYQRLLFWDYADRELPNNEKVIQDLVDLIQDQHMQFVYAPSVWEIHPDHITLADVAVEAVRRCGDTVTLLMYEVGVALHPNILLALDAHLERKRQAIACFQSQLRLNDYRRHMEALHVYRSYTLPPEIKMAEGFYQISGANLQLHPEKRYGPCRQTFELESVSLRLRQLA